MEQKKSRLGKQTGIRGVAGRAGGVGCEDGQLAEKGALVSWVWEGERGRLQCGVGEGTGEAWFDTASGMSGVQV